MEKNHKTKALAELVRKRRRAKLEGYGNLAEFGYECEFVSPYTKSACNLKAKVLVMLQDWTSADANADGPDETAAKLGYTPSLPTNVRLDRLLKEHFGLQRAETCVFRRCRPVIPAEAGHRFRRMSAGGRQGGETVVDVRADVNSR